MIRLILTSTLLFLFCYGSVQADSKFASASVIIEQNVTDKDMEVVIEATGGDDGMALLKVVGPKGRTIIDFKSPDSALGLRHFKFESPEPKNHNSMKADFPEGEYVFKGQFVSGKKLYAKVMLSHKLPAVTPFIYPRPDANKVPYKGLVLKWQRIGNPASYIVEIEQEQSGLSSKTKLSSNTVSLAVPDGLLIAGTKYKISIGAVAQDGNSSFIETEFKTRN